MGSRQWVVSAIAGVATFAVGATGALILDKREC
jgi:hypothetical protein